MKMVDEDLESFKIYNNRDTSFKLKESKSALTKFAIHYRLDEKDCFDPDLFLVKAKHSITNPL